MADYKGGYQIVEIETGLSGMYKKLEAAYNSGKPILVKKNGKISFGNVTKDGNYYVANYIIDDTLYQDTISALDAITDSSIDIGGNAGDIEALEERVNANVMLVASRTLLDDYTDPSDPTKIFTCPSDGYVNFKVQGTIGNKYGVTIYDPGSTGAQAIQAKLANAGAYDQFYTVFVKKGMRLVCSENTGTGNYGYFIPLEN